MGDLQEISCGEQRRRSCEDQRLCAGRYREIKAEVMESFECNC